MTRDEHARSLARTITTIFRGPENQVPNELVALIEEALLGEYRRTVNSDPLNGEWLDKWGGCRVCGGEIPHGHTNNCDIFKYEKMERAADAMEKTLRDARYVLIGAHQAFLTNRDSTMAQSMLIQAKPIDDVLDVYRAAKKELAP